MTEIILGGKKLADDHFHLYEQLCSYNRKPYINRNGKAKERAYKQFIESTGHKPLAAWNFDMIPDVYVRKATEAKIKALWVEFQKRKVP